MSKWPRYRKTWKRFSQRLEPGVLAGLIICAAFGGIMLAGGLTILTRGVTLALIPAFFLMWLAVSAWRDLTEWLTEEREKKKKNSR